jgi:hypothetical protein
METSKMDDILGTKNQAAEPAPPPAEPVAAKTDETVPVFDPESGDHPVPRKHFVEERKKRQEYERQLAEYKGQLSVYEQQAQRQQQAPAEKPDASADFYADPLGFTEKRIAAAVGQQRLELSQEMMRATKPDYDDMERVFLEAARENPALANQLRASPNPAKFAYDYAKHYAQVKDIGGMEQYAEKIRAEERAKIEAEWKAKETAAQVAGVSKSAATIRGAVTSTEGGSFAPTPLKAMVGARKSARG